MSTYVQSHEMALQEILHAHYTMEFYQREYVWGRKQLEDLILDLSSEFLRSWQCFPTGHSTDEIGKYHPYFMGEIVLSEKGGNQYAIIDGQQRITTITLLLMYLRLRFWNVLDEGTISEIGKLIFSSHRGTYTFNLDIPERQECMESLRQDGRYQVKDEDPESVKNIVARYEDIADCWNDQINETNIRYFVFWLFEKVMFSKVWTNSDEFAYVIFETMNDRGKSLTQVEMLRSYLLAHVEESHRQGLVSKIDSAILALKGIALNSISKAEFEFFKIFLRGHYAESLSQKDAGSDFVLIGNAFHRWVSDNSNRLGMVNSGEYERFIDTICYYVSVYERINALVAERNWRDYLYLIINADYGFTLQPALILASVNYQDDNDEVSQKIKIVSRYLSQFLSWKVWNLKSTAQSYMEATIYRLCKEVRGKTSSELDEFLCQNARSEFGTLQAAPILNPQFNRKFRVLLSLITEIVVKESQEGKHVLDSNVDFEIEHIWSNHFDQHRDECPTEQEFDAVRNKIGDLLVLPKSDNASYRDACYRMKVEHYYGQNVLAQSLNIKKYENNPGFRKFLERSGLPFRGYEDFTKSSIEERTDLYRKILLWNWRDSINPVNPVNPV